MSRIDEVRSAMVAAMKAGEKERKDSLSMLLSALKNKAIDKREDLTEEEENEVVLKEIKQTKETLDLTPADRTDIIDEWGCVGPSLTMFEVCSIGGPSGIQPEYFGFQGTNTPSMTSQ